MKYNRILLKLSGETLSGSDGKGIDFESVLDICKEIKECKDLGCEIGIVVGGGNFWRGRSNQHMDRCTADHIGMLATTMNALALQDGFKQIGCESRVQTGIEMRQIAEFYIKNRAVNISLKLYSLGISLCSAINNSKGSYVAYFLLIFKLEI